MIDRETHLSPHFTLDELLPQGLAELPGDVRERLTSLCVLLEAIRFHFGLPIIVHDAYRLPEHNAVIGGVHESDHLTGRAADFHVTAGGGFTWEQNTVAAFRFLRDQMAGRFGQIILEDHREHLNKPGKLWVHVALPTERHPGHDDLAAVLLSTIPGQYTPAIHST